MVDVLVQPELRTRIKEQLAAIGALQQQLVDTIQVAFADAPAPAVTALERAQQAAAELAPGARVWDVSPAALENYTASELVALKADHRADGHAPGLCATCEVLARRLGALD